MATRSSKHAPVMAAGRFASHVGEMVLAMFVGMAVLGAVWGLLLAAAGTSVDDVLETAPAVVALALMFNMTAPMLAWMHHKGHPRAELVEMTAAMGSVALVAVVLLSVSAIDSKAICGVECGLMIPAMIVAMWPHRREYGVGERKATAAGSALPRAH